MAGSKINVLMSLTDQFTAPLKKVNESIKGTQRELKLAQNSVRGFGKSLNDSFLTLAEGAIAGVGAAFAGAAAGIGVLAQESMQLADAQIKAETMLRQALSNVKSIKEGEAGALDAAYNELTRYASALQETGVVGDEVTLMGMKQLATFQLSGETIKTLSKGMLDLAVNTKGVAVSQEDMANFGNLLGKAMLGNVGALTRYGISLSDEQKELIKTGDETQRAAVLAQVLQENVGGMNEALRQTDQGKVQHALNAYGDMLEEFGKKLNPLKASLYSAFEGLLPQIQAGVMPVLDELGTVFEQLAPKITTAMSTIVQYIPAVIDTVVTVISFAIEHFGDLMSLLDALTPVIAGIVAGFAAFNAISGVLALIASIGAAIVKLKVILAGCTTVMSVFNALMLANPVAMVAVAIGVLTAALVLLYQNWDAVVQGCLAAWQWFCDSVTSWIEMLITVYGNLIMFIVNVFTGNWSDAWQNIVNIFASIFGTIKSIAAAPLNWISDKLSSIGSKIKDTLGFTGSYSAPEEEHNALGTSFFKGGSTYVNEGNRGELITLPSGSQIVPHDLAKQAVSGNQTINVNLNIAGNVIGNEEFINECGAAISGKITAALANM